MNKLPQHIHFTGCGGVGMGGVAHIAADLGCVITGSDIAESKISKALLERGLDIRYGHFPALPKATELLVYSSAVNEEDLERKMAHEAGIPQMCRGEFLALLCKTSFEKVVAVGGSHGKTTTTAMIAYVLKKLGIEPGYMVGGNVIGWQRNASAGKKNVLVTEADESDGTQALLETDIAVILNIDDDHFWSLGGQDKLEDCFHTFALKSKRPLCFADDSKACRILGGHPALLTVEVDDTMTLPVPGFFNRRNGSIACRVVEQLGLSSFHDAVEALKDFPGVERRMNILLIEKNSVVVEDYAHHPTELEALLKTIAQEYSDSRIVAYFQPHRFERLEYFGHRFAEILSHYCFETHIVAPFAAWHDNVHGIGAQNLVNEINEKSPSSCVLVPCNPEGLAEEIKKGISETKEKRVVLIIGAGDIGKIRQYICHA